VCLLFNPLDSVLFYFLHCPAQDLGRWFPSLSRAWIENSKVCRKQSCNIKEQSGSSTNLENTLLVLWDSSYSALAMCPVGWGPRITRYMDLKCWHLVFKIANAVQVNKIHLQAGFEAQVTSY
jgi:hypothetical protein